jgi:hypothetical protein
LLIFVLLEVGKVGTLLLLWWVLVITSHVAGWRLVLAAFLSLKCDPSVFDLLFAILAIVLDNLKTCVGKLPFHCLL